MTTENRRSADVIRMGSDCRLIANAFLIGLEPAMRRRLQQSAHEQCFRAGDVLFEGNQEATRFSLICSGRVEERFTISGMPLVELQAGDVLGACCLVSPYLHMSTAVALTPVKLLTFERHDAEALCDANHDFGYSLYQRLFAVMVDRIQQANAGGRRSGELGRG